MGIADNPQAVRRSWSVLVRMCNGKALLTCEHCGALPQEGRFPIIRREVLAHLADHARSDPLAFHLRTCRCGERNCRWHPHHRGCSGPVSLALTRTSGGRAWRLADVCFACAAATGHTAVVQEAEERDSSLFASHSTHCPAQPASGDHQLDGGESEEEYFWWG